MERLHCIVLLAASLLAVSYASVAPRQTKSVRPAFSVGLTHNISFTQPQNVAYDRVFLDSTSSYNPVTGVYTVPTSGDYVVMMHALSELNGQLWLDLYRNDDYLISAYAHTTAQYAAASNVGVVRFNASDLLHVKGHGDSILYGYSDEVYTTLSAYLLYASKN